MIHPLFDNGRGGASVRTGVPSGDWSRDELRDRAAAENDEITNREHDASHYWFLGKALLPIRADLDEGPWNRWCEETKIERTRWYRAMLLARAFGSPEEFGGLSIASATDLARERLGIEPCQTPLEAKHQRRLRSMTKTLQNSLDDLDGQAAAEFAAVDGLLLAIDDAGRRLRELRHAYVASRAAARQAKRGSRVAVNV